MLVIAFPLLFCFGKAQSQLESLMQNFTNEYALQNIELYNIDDYTHDPNIRTGGSFISSIEDVIKF